MKIRFPQEKQTTIFPLNQFLKFINFLNQLQNFIFKETHSNFLMNNIKKRQVKQKEKPDFKNPVNGKKKITIKQRKILHHQVDS